MLLSLQLYFSVDFYLVDARKGKLTIDVKITHEFLSSMSNKLGL